MVIVKRLKARRRIRPQKNRRGFALITMVVMTWSLFSISASYLTLSVQERQDMLASENALKAQALAEAGLEDAMWQYRHNNGAFSAAQGWGVSGSDATKVASSFTDNSGNVIGSYSVTVTNYSGNALVTSTGTASAAGTGTQARVKARVPGQPIFGNGLLADGQIFMKNDAYTDSYDSSLGAYNAPLGASNNVFQNGSVVTNSTSSEAVLMENDVMINGDATTGPGGVVTEPTQVTGTISHTANQTLDPVTVPGSLSDLSSGGALIVQNNDIVNLYAGSYKYSSMDIKNDSTLNINGAVNIYVTGEVMTQNDAQLVLLSGGSLNLYVDGKINVKNDGFANQTLEPTAFQIFGTPTCTEVMFENDAQVHGVINAPSAVLKVKNDAQLFGAAIASSMIFENDGAIHFDEELQDSGPMDNDHKMKWWRRTQ